MSHDIPITRLRLALRIANSFLIEHLTAARGERDFADALILAALVQSNSGALAGDSTLQHRHGAFEAPPPADIRRPISMSALAASLGLPFETVRRRLKRLAAAGVCEIGPEGVRYADAMLGSAEHRRVLETIYVQTRSLYLRLRLAGYLDVFAPPKAPPWRGESPPMRIVYRAASDYFLRMMEHLLPRFTNLSRAFIVLAVVRINTAAFPDTLRGAEGLDPEAFVADSYRRPARASEVSALLGLPGETVRRNLAALVEDGRCQRSARGYIVPAAVLARPNVIMAWDANLRDLARLFGELGENGVLALWDAEEAGHPSAALIS